VETSSKPVLLYDGECGLCNALVHFMLRHDRRGVLVFAPLQGKTGQAFLRGHGMNTQDFDSLVFIDDLTRADTGFFLRTEGALRALEYMGGGWRRVACVLRVVPVSCRDVFYRMVARMRYRLFGRYQPEPLPNREWERRILE
jgi:predicted DCC family thiol-disulfide oxidoreductase YuxK